MEGKKTEYMDIDLIRLLVDFGFMVLIWAVQLVIYPSFLFYTKKNLVKWHRLYTKRVTLIVLPLMGSQLLLSIAQFLERQQFYETGSLIIICSLWVLTFKIFVPRHQKIDKGLAKPQVTAELVRYNWIRTVLWSVLFMMSISHRMLMS